MCVLGALFRIAYKQILLSRGQSAVLDMQTDADSLTVYYTHEIRQWGYRRVDRMIQTYSNTTGEIQKQLELKSSIYSTITGTYFRIKGGTYLIVNGERLI